MTAPTFAAFTVTVKHQEVFYDVEVTPLFNGTPIQGIGDRLTQWTEAEKTHQIFSRALQEILDKSQIPDARLTAQLLTVGWGQGIVLEDRTQIKGEETKKACDTFIRYLQDPDVGKAELPALDDADSIGGLGFSMKIAANAYLNLRPDEQYKTRLSLFEKKCREYFGLPRDSYTPLEVSCRAFLLKQRDRSSRAPSSETEKQQLAREINAWFVHKYLLLADANAERSKEEMQQIENERTALGKIEGEMKAAATKAAEAQSENETVDEHLLSDSEDSGFESFEDGDISDD